MASVQMFRDCESSNASSRNPMKAFYVALLVVSMVFPFYSGRALLMDFANNQYKERSERLKIDARPNRPSSFFGLTAAEIAALDEHVGAAYKASVQDGYRLGEGYGWLWFQALGMDTLLLVASVFGLRRCGTPAVQKAGESEPVDDMPPANYEASAPPPLPPEGLAQKSSMPASFKCSQCDEIHEGLPLSFGADAPAAYYAIPEHQRAERAILSSDQCIIDDTHYFVRACLDIPIHGGTDVFRWGVWVSLSEQSFERMTELWETKGREFELPYFGWLCTPLPIYPETTNLKTQVHTRPLGERPSIELEPTDHPLAVEQRTGISPARAREIAETLLHQRKS